MSIRDFIQNILRYITLQKENKYYKNVLSSIPMFGCTGQVTLYFMVSLLSDMFQALIRRVNYA